MKHLVFIGGRGFAREMYYMALLTNDHKNGVFDIKGFKRKKIYLKSYNIIFIL